MATALFLVGDTHIGLQTPTFNTEVAAQALRTATTNMLQVLKHYPEVKSVAVALLGDIVEGENVYPTQAHALDHLNPQTLNSIIPYLQNIELHHPTSAALLLQTYLAAAIIAHEVVLPVAQRGYEVTVSGCIGNHGRITKHHHPLTNADAFTYFFLREMLKGTKKIKVMLGADLFYPLIIYNHTILLYHGEHIPIYQRVPYYGLERRARDWQGAEIFGRLAAVCVGHFHTAFYLAGPPPIIGNGTLVCDHLYPVYRIGAKGVNHFWLVIVTETDPIASLHKIYFGY